ncbi:EthD domain-containing protein [Pseudofrankia sp. DC12]|uniref:EthD domain-containing protein n=1 Tax=Pseudofrankia sp. DC12 TaxID=683315 RepID=UPI0005F7F3E9|nr:EthD domain-containing protein [Pseudofrankia sp. DC12]
MSADAAPAALAATGAGLDGPSPGEILLFLFTRRDGMSEEQFREHYLGVHAPMSVAHSTATGRYVVRLVEGGHGSLPLPVDAITEIHTASVDAFVDPEQGWDSAENWKLVIDDAASFLAGFHMYRVSREVLVPAAGAAEPTTVRARTPGVVLAQIFLDGAAAQDATDEAAGPAAIPGTVRYRVLGTLSPDAPPVHAVDLVTLPDATAARYRSHAYVLGEYVQQP